MQRNNNLQTRFFRGLVCVLKQHARAVQKQDRKTHPIRIHPRCWMATLFKVTGRGDTLRFSTQLFMFWLRKAQRSKSELEFPNRLSAQRLTFPWHTAINGRLGHYSSYINKNCNHLQLLLGTVHKASGQHTAQQTKRSQHFCFYPTYSQEAILQRLLKLSCYAAPSLLSTQYQSNSAVQRHYGQLKTQTRIVSKRHCKQTRSSNAHILKARVTLYNPVFQHQHGGHCQKRDL